MILLFTDFTLRGPYVGQMHHAVFTHGYANGIPVVDLMHDAPRQNPRAASYLLAALIHRMAPGNVCVAVVDPGVGTDRIPVIVKADERYFVGPDNGLFEISARQSRHVETFRITWQPDILSASFHGRDLFAPVAAKLAVRLNEGSGDRGWVDGLAEPCSPSTDTSNWPDDLDDVIYIDGFGNCVLGRRAARAPPQMAIHLGKDVLNTARSFGDVPEGAGFWYENSMGLVEIAVNGGSAAARYGLSIGSTVGFYQPSAR